MFELADRLVGIYKTDNCTKSVTIDPYKIGQHSATTVPTPIHSEAWTLGELLSDADSCVACDDGISVTIHHWHLHVPLSEYSVAITMLIIDWLKLGFSVYQLKRNSFTFYAVFS